jgi:hypothetical protein
MVRTAPTIMTDQHAGFASRAGAFATDLVIINLALVLTAAAAGTVLQYFDLPISFTWARTQRHWGNSSSR